MTDVELDLPLFIWLFGARSDWPLVVRVLYIGAFAFLILLSFLVTLPGAVHPAAPAARYPPSLAAPAR
jgi:hypothetical protein